MHLMIPQISVIIPVYNCVNYLQECLDSVLNQKNVSIEVILVNDGSTDGSEIIAMNYAKKDARITLINQENSGVSAARQVGINKSIGEYITFVDADDTLPENALKELYVNNEQYDMVVGHLYFVYADGKKKNVGTKPHIADKITFIKKLLLAEIFVGPYARITKRTLFDENTSNIPREIITGEDTILNIRIGTKLATYKYIDNVVYNYKIGVPNSLFTSTKTTLSSVKERWPLMVQPLIDASIIDLYKNELLWIKAINLLMVLNCQYTLDTNDEFVKETISDVKKLKWSIKNSRIKLTFFLLKKSMLNKNIIIMLRYIQKMLHLCLRLVGQGHYTSI